MIRRPVPPRERLKLKAVEAAAALERARQLLALRKSRYDREAEMVAAAEQRVATASRRALRAEAEVRQHAVRTWARGEA